MLSIENADEHQSDGIWWVKLSHHAGLFEARVIMSFSLNERQGSHGWCSNKLAPNTQQLPHQIKAKTSRTIASMQASSSNEHCTFSHINLIFSLAGRSDAIATVTSSLVFCWKWRVWEVQMRFAISWNSIYTRILIEGTNKPIFSLFLSGVNMCNMNLFSVEAWEDERGNWIFTQQSLAKVETFNFKTISINFKKVLELKRFETTERPTSSDWILARPTSNNFARG